MNEMPFPKPSPADPLPLETWLRRTDRSEVGREPFFRGRDAEYGVYRSAVTSLSEGIIGGGTIVFQGGPYLALSGGGRLEEARLGWRVIADGPDAPDLELELFLKSFTEMETPGDGG